jgi:hypothetical protein
MMLGIILVSGWQLGRECIMVDYSSFYNKVDAAKAISVKNPVTEGIKANLKPSTSGLMARVQNAASAGMADFNQQKYTNDVGEEKDTAYAAQKRAERDSIDWARNHQTRIKAAEEELLSYSGSSTVSENNPMADVLDSVEGGGNYDTLFNFSQNTGKFGNVKVSQMTIGELKAFTDPSGEYGQYVKKNNPDKRVSTPMGRWQITGSTMSHFASKLGYDDDTVFTPSVQDTIAVAIGKQAIGRYDSIEGKRKALTKTWQGLNNVETSQIDNLITYLEEA